jgi:hypothetical protein
VGEFAFSGLDQVPSWIHKKKTGGNYFMGSGAVRYFGTNEVALTAGTNYWLSSEQ